MTRRRKDDYADYVNHPRYGRSPKLTGWNPHTDYGGDTFLHWHSPKECRIPNTAIAADLSRQTPATVAVTHYYDVQRKCRDCLRPFIFFAAEQKHWYEQLGFGLDSDCVRCVDCRNIQRKLALQKTRYEELSHVAERTIDETIEMADCCLSLVEAAIFSGQSTQHVRTLLNSIPSDSKVRRQRPFTDLVERLEAVEA